ncbi:MAG TPA: Uma2 family endonuclease [Thermoanaerobaculia bacterium]|nr:Uma2 family endonuclease [Thermoanaerobaculia bacterium]
MAVREPARRKLTYDDYVLIPEDGQRHEILDGEHYVSPAPTPHHQGVSGALYARLWLFARQHDLGRVYSAPLDILFSIHDVAQPDLVFISNERARIIGDKNVQGTPDLVVEILSPSTRRRDEGIKRDLYERSGVREYWLIDPERQEVRVFRRDSSGFKPAAELSATAGDVLSTPLLPGLEIRVLEIFE